MKKRSDYTPAEIEFIERVGREVVDALSETPFEPDGTIKAAMKSEDGNYRMKPIPPNVSFFFQSAYLGARGETLFCFSPEDDQDFDVMELPMKQVDIVFPLAGAELATAFELEGENFKTVYDLVFLKVAEDEKHAESRAKQAYSQTPGFGAF